MKALLLVLLAFPTMSFSQEITALMQPPKILELKKYMSPATDKLELRYFEERNLGTPRVVVKTAPSSAEVNDVYKAVLSSDDIGRIYCDGEYFTNSIGAGQVIQVAKIKVCIDDEGEVLVHSVGYSPKLTDAQVKASVEFITKNRKASTDNPKINDGRASKETAGVFSDKLKRKDSSR